jgi:hypothetical protein
VDVRFAKIVDTLKLVSIEFAFKFK